jgi:hypothetical protein
VQLDFALSIRTVIYAMAASMALAFLVALLRMSRGRVEQPVEAAGAPAAAARASARPL